MRAEVRNCGCVCPEPRAGRLRQELTQTGLSKRTRNLVLAVPSGPSSLQPVLPQDSSSPGAQEIPFCFSRMRLGFLLLTRGRGLPDSDQSVGHGRDSIGVSADECARYADGVDRTRRRSAGRTSSASSLQQRDRWPFFFAFPSSRTSSAAQNISGSLEV